MKHFLLLLCVFISYITYGQNVPPGGTGEIYIFDPVSAQRVRASDSVQIYATLYTNNTAKTIAWSQPVKQAIKITPVNDYATGAIQTSRFWLQGLTPGIDTFFVTGISGTGTTSTKTIVLTVLPDIACPPIPAQRIAVSVSFTLAGIPITIPLPTVGVSVKYDTDPAQ